MLEVHEEWPEYYKMADEKDIDKTEEEMRGFVTGPTNEEIARRRGFPEPGEHERVEFGGESSGIVHSVK